MTEKIQDQISAFIDDELSAEECSFFVRRLERDPEAREQLIRYSTAGAAIRGELLQPDPGVLRRRLQHAMDGVAFPAGQLRGRQRAGSRFLKPALGFGIAASVAAAAIFTLQGIMGGGANLGSIVQNQQQALQPAAPSYVVPQDVPEDRLLSSPITLTNYMVHHGEYASRLGRNFVLSNVVIVSENDVALDSEDGSE